MKRHFFVAYKLKDDDSVKNKSFVFEADYDVDKCIFTIKRSLGLHYVDYRMHLGEQEQCNQAVTITFFHTWLQ